MTTCFLAQIVRSLNFFDLKSSVIFRFLKCLTKFKE